MPHGPPGSPEKHLSSILDLRRLLWDPFLGLLAPFGVLWGSFGKPLGLLWAPFGSVLDTQGHLWRPSGGLWRPFAHLNVFFEPSAVPSDFSSSL